MKAQVVNFFYQNKNEKTAKARTIFVLNHTEEHLQGIDFGKLTPKERSLVRKTFKNREIKNEFVTKGFGSSHTANPEITAIIGKAFRNFKIENIQLKQIVISKDENKALTAICEKLGTKKAVHTGLKRAANKVTKTYKGFEIVKSRDGNFKVNIKSHSIVNIATSFVK